MGFPGLGIPELFIVLFLLVLLPTLWAWAVVHCFRRRDDPDRIAWLIVLCVVPVLAVPVYGWLQLRGARNSPGAPALVFLAFAGWAGSVVHAAPPSLTTQAPEPTCRWICRPVCRARSSGSRC